MMKRSRSGVTIPEIALVLLACVLIVGLLMPLAQRPGRVPVQVKGSTMLRGIVQGFQLFASSNDGHFPLASRVDQFNHTEGDPNTGAAAQPTADRKDRTGAILSVAIYSDMFTPELCVDPGEVGDVRVFDQYQFRAPTGANNPSRAVYDPAFNGTPFDNANDAHMQNNVGARDTASHNSYAHNCVAFGRAADWTDRTPPSTALWASRGPVYTDNERAAYDPARPGWELLPDHPLGDGSDSLLLYGDEDAWAGNVARADGAVVYSESPQIEGVNAPFAPGPVPGTSVADNIFVDEHFEDADASLRRNAYLRQWKRGIPAGEIAPHEFAYTTHLAPSNDAKGFAWTD